MLVKCKEGGEWRAGLQPSKALIATKILPGAGILFFSVSRHCPINTQYKEKKNPVWMNFF
jgi:hypothetical protein